MTPSFKTMLSISCLAVIIPGIQPVMAEQVSADTSLDTITVTAQKREENVQNVPIAMDVIDETELQDANIYDLKTLTGFSPNIFPKQNTNQNMLIIRGISSHNVVLNTPVGLFVDDINYPMTYMQNPDLLDVERVEILRGPQGTLYGRNTESGVVKIITRQPDNEFCGKIFSDIGMYDTHDTVPLYRLGASLNVPLVNEKLFVSLAGQTKQSDGYTVNIYNDNDEAGKIDHKNGQITLRWLPTEHLDITLLANFATVDDGYGHLRYWDGPSATERYHVNWDGANSWEDKNNGQALKIKYEAPSFTLLAITTRNDFETDFKNDGEFGPFPFGDQVWFFDNTTISQEIRLSSIKDSGPWEWLAGVYGFTDENTALGEFFGQSRYTEFDSTGYALFGQMTYTLFDRLHLTAGLRYDYLDVDGEQHNRMVPAPYSATMEHREWLPKISAAYDITPDIMTYASVSRGLLAGGYNYPFANNSSTLTFAPEKTWNYEAGIKTRFWDNKCTFNAALFYIDITDKQVEEWLAGPGARSVTNAARAHSQGFEVDMELRPWQGVRIFGGFGYSEVKFDDWVSMDMMTGLPYDYDGNELPFAPKYTYNLGLSYTHLSGFWCRVDLLGNGDYYTSAKNKEKVDGHNRVNLTLGYKGESFDISLWAKNVFDEEYVTSNSAYIGGNHITEDAPPRSLGLSMTYYF